MKQKGILPDFEGFGTLQGQLLDQNGLTDARGAINKKNLRRIRGGPFAFANEFIDFVNRSNLVA